MNVKPSEWKTAHVVKQCCSVIHVNEFNLLLYREMLDRALVKRLRDSDSDSEKEEESSSSSQSVTSRADKPTDILTTDQHTETQVCNFSLRTFYL